MILRGTLHGFWVGKRANRRIFPGVDRMPPPVVFSTCRGSTPCPSTAAPGLNHLTGESLIGMAAAQQALDALRVAQDHRADLEQLQPDGPGPARASSVPARPSARNRSSST